MKWTGEGNKCVYLHLSLCVHIWLIFISVSLYWKLCSHNLQFLFNTRGLFILFSLSLFVTSLTERNLALIILNMFTYLISPLLRNWSCITVICCYHLLLSTTGALLILLELWHPLLSLKYHSHPPVWMPFLPCTGSYSLPSAASWCGHPPHPAQTLC